MEVQENAVVPKSDKRSVRYDFSTAESHEIALKMSRDMQAEDRLKDEFDSVKSQYKARMDEIRARINKNAQLVRDGFEYRDIEHTIEYNVPVAGKKTLTRIDNKETIVERMEEWEFNLFTQPEENIASVIDTNVSTVPDHILEKEVMQQTKKNNDKVNAKKKTGGGKKGAKNKVEEMLPPAVETEEQISEEELTDLLTDENNVEKDPLY